MFQSRTGDVYILIYIDYKVGGGGGGGGGGTGYIYLGIELQIPIYQQNLYNNFSPFNFL